MATKERVLACTGVHEGATTNLGGVDFVQGLATLCLSDEDFEGVAKYLGRSHGCVEVLENGSRQDHSGWSGRAVPPVPVEIQEDRGTSEEAEVHGEADDEAGEGSERVPPEGDGPSGPDLERLKDVIGSLDPDNPEHWTEEGRPRVDVVCELYGGNVTRADIDLVCQPEE